MTWRTKISKILYFFLFIFMIKTTPALADHNQYLFDQANKLYQQEQYQEAIKNYLEIINNGYESWQLYYNLGSAYYKIGEFGRAILNYERALKLNPKNEDIQFNLQVANLSVVDKITIPPQFFISKWLSDLKSLWGIQTLTFLALGFYLITVLLIILKIFVRKVRAQRLLNVLLVPILILLVIISFLLFVRISESNSINYAIVLVDKVDVLSSPENQGTELFSLHKGVKLQVDELQGEWAKIRLADGKIGWVRRDVFEVI
jgi:tetratricopeptide (TPR) repeat protein